MICPRCNAQLAISNTHDVEIDYCPNCRGVWLDRGELEKIIERSNSYYPSQYKNNEHFNQYYDEHHGHHDSHHEYRHHSKHKRGFLSDLFDF